MSWGSLAPMAKLDVVIDGDLVRRSPGALLRGEGDVAKQALRGVRCRRCCRQGRTPPACTRSQARGHAVDGERRFRTTASTTSSTHDDYLQDHRGTIAAIRSLRCGEEPKPWFGDSANPADPEVRSLAEEAGRAVRTRVLNPKWIGAMCRHGYKGGFEMAATVDYLSGYDATAHERVTDACLADAAVRKLFEQSNPWALRSIAERLLEPKDRTLWDASPEAPATLRSALLGAEAREDGR